MILSVSLQKMHLTVAKNELCVSQFPPKTLLIFRSGLVLYSYLL